MRTLFKITLLSLLLMTSVFASTNNGIGGSTGGSSSMDWSEIFAMSTRYKAHFPSIVYKGSNIRIDNLCDNGVDIITAEEVPVMVQSDKEDANSPKILEYQKVTIPKWRLIYNACQETGTISDELCNRPASDKSPLKYKVKIEDLDAEDTISTFEKIYAIPSCEEWQYQRQSFDSSSFWQSFSGA